MKTKCTRCRRQLKSRKSQINGAGPSCKAKLNRQHEYEAIMAEISFEPSRFGAQYGR